jgi:hypothetical protein
MPGRLTIDETRAGGAAFVGKAKGRLDGRPSA